MLISLRTVSTTLLILLISVSVNPEVIAQIDCEGSVNQVHEKDQSDSERLESLQKLERTCGTNPRLYAIKGVLELNAGEVDRSLLSLERAVMLDPLNGESMIDYAVALNASGQHKLALRVVRRLLSQPNVPKGVKKQLVDFEGLLHSNMASSQTVKGIAAEKPTQFVARRGEHPLTSTLRMQTGFGSNLNAGSSADSIEIKVSDETLNLRLPPDYRPQAGYFTELGYQTQISSVDSPRQLLLFANHRVAQVDNYESTALGATQRYLLEQNPLFQWMDTKALLHRSQGELNPVLSVSAAFARPRLILLDDLSLNLERNFASKKSTARMSQVSLVGIRKFSLGKSQGQLHAGANLTHYEGSYWGGKRISGSVGVQLTRQIDKTELWASLRSYSKRDSEGFSELLDNNRPLTVNGSEVAFGAGVKFDSNSRLDLRLRHNDESSNIDLYRNRASFIRLGYRYSW